MGATERPRGFTPFARLSNGESEGIRVGQCAGTYLHGALENAVLLSELLGYAIPEPSSKEKTYDYLADWFSSHANMDLFAELYL
jgi:cobyric acid synthase